MVPAKFINNHTRNVVTRGVRGWLSQNVPSSGWKMHRNTSFVEKYIFMHLARTKV